MLSSGTSFSTHVVSRVPIVATQSSVFALSLVGVVVGQVEHTRSVMIACVVSCLLKLQCLALIPPVRHAIVELQRGAAELSTELQRPPWARPGDVKPSTSGRLVFDCAKSDMPSSTSGAEPRIFPPNLEDNLLVARSRPHVTQEELESARQHLRQEMWVMVEECKGVSCRLEQDLHHIGQQVKLGLPP